MESSVLAMFVFLLLGAVVSHSVLPPEIYWKTMLPDVPMPKAVKELLQPGNAGKDVSDGVELDPNVFTYNSGKQADPNVFTYNGGKQSDPNVFTYSSGKHSRSNAFSYKAGKQSDRNAFSYNTGKQSDPNVFTYNGGKQFDPNVFTYNGGKQFDPNVFTYNGGKQSEPNVFTYNVGKHSEPNAFSSNAAKQSDPNVFSYNTGKQSDPNVFTYNAGKQPDPNSFMYDAGKQSDPNAFVYNTEFKDKVHDYDDIFFLEKELHPGTKINVHLARSTMGAIFLPRQQAATISFSSDMLSKVMEQFSVKPHSMEAKIMEQTIKTCEEPAQEGEEKYCATSLESMVDFVVYKLGKNVHSISTEVGKEETSRQQYTTGLGIKRMGGANSIVCHNQAYAYPIYYCHATHSTKVYVIPFSTTEGSTTTAIAVCHTDTSKWNPEHLAFQVLKIKPGTVPVCHFLPEGHIVWTSDETLA